MSRATTLSSSTTINCVMASPSTAASSPVPPAFALSSTHSVRRTRRSPARPGSALAHPMRRHHQVLGRPFGSRRRHCPLFASSRDGPRTSASRVANAVATANQTQTNAPVATFAAWTTRAVTQERQACCAPAKTASTAAPGFVRAHYEHRPMNVQPVWRSAGTVPPVVCRGLKRPSTGDKP